MNILDTEDAVTRGQTESVSLYCMASMVAEQASRGGHSTFAKSMESVLGGFLSEMSREDQRHALQLSYQMMLGGAEPAKPRLKLVYSRD